MSKAIRFGPLALTSTTTTNIFNPPAVSGGVNAGTQAVRCHLTHLRIVNKTALAHNFSLWLGGTGANAAGTEFIGTGVNVAANSYFDWYGKVPLDAADFLVGGADANTSLTIQGEGELVVV